MIVGPAVLVTVHRSNGRPHIDIEEDPAVEQVEGIDPEAPLHLQQRIPDCRIGVERRRRLLVGDPDAQRKSRIDPEVDDVPRSADLCNLRPELQIVCVK